MIFRLSYVSAVTAEAAASLASAMEDILVISAANNRRDGITGFLVCDGHEFAQVLEGPREEVEACFFRIRADRRNAEAALRELSWADERAFPRWSMCGLTLSGVDDALLTVPDIGSALSRLSTGALWQHLESLALRHADVLDWEHERLVHLSG
jgi:hypothetical protein